jgi:putative ABC transport system permease protein
LAPGSRTPPHLQAITAHRVDPLNLPWWAIVVGMVLAIVTSIVAARRPARALAQIPIVAALAGRPAMPKAVYRSAGLGLALLAIGVGFLAFTGGWAANSGSAVLLLLMGLVAVIIGWSLLAPQFVAVLAAAAGPRVPVAVRIALRDLVRYRARSGAALAAVCVAVFLSVLICIIASVRFSNVLDWTGPNLTANQLIVYTPYGATGPQAVPSTPPTQSQLNALDPHRGRSQRQDPPHAHRRHRRGHRPARGRARHRGGHHRGPGLGAQRPVHHVRPRAAS